MATFASLPVALGDSCAAEAVLRREQLAGVHADDGRVQHVEADRREEIGHHEETERRDRHSAAQGRTP